MAMKITGMKELKDVLRRYPRGLNDAAAVAQSNAAQHVMVIAKARAPFEEGDLEASAFVSDPKHTGQAVTVEYGFGGDAVPYMVRQHEDLSLNHPGLDSKTTNPGRAAQGEAKFLESAVTESQDVIEREYVEALKYFLATGRLPAQKAAPITNKG